MKSRVSFFVFCFVFFCFFAYPAGNCPLADNLAALSSGHTRDGNANRNDRNVEITTVTHVDSRLGGYQYLVEKVVVFLFLFRGIIIVCNVSDKITSTFSIILFVVFPSS